MSKEKIMKDFYGYTYYGVCLVQSENCGADIRVEGSIELRKIAAPNKNEAYNMAKDQMIRTLGIICVLKNGDRRNSIFAELEEFWPENE